MKSIFLKKLDDSAIIPIRAHDTDAGYDLFSIEEYELKPLERKPFKTGIAIAIPLGLYGRVAPRSGLAVKKGIDVLAGVVDCTYRGEIMAVLINFSNEPVKINKGDKIAQIIFEYYNDVTFVEQTELDTTVRGEKGFGSSDLPVVTTTTDSGEVKSLKVMYESLYTKLDVKHKKYEDVIKNRS